MTTARFVGAGLAAGVANLILGFTFAHFLSVEKLQALLREHGLRVIGEPSDALPHVLVRLLMGLGVTALFVCVAPRFGGGPRAALAAGAFAWAFVPAFTAWGHVHIGLFPRSWDLGSRRLGSRRDDGDRVRRRLGGNGVAILAVGGGGLLLDAHFCLGVLSCPNTEPLA